MKNIKIYLTSVIITIILLACSNKENNEIPKIEPAGKPLVRVKKAEQSTIQALSNYSGKIKAEKSIDIAPELSMRIISVYIDEGDKVKAGQLLAKLDTTKLAQARIQFKDAEKNFKRMQALRESEYVEAQKFEQVKAVYETSKYNFGYIRDNTIIRAPFSGIITAKNKKEGEFYSSMLPGVTGNPSLFRLVNLDDLKVIFHLPDNDIKKIKNGQKAKIEVEITPNQSYSGVITFVSAEADPYSGMFPCYVKILNPDESIKPNLFARVGIITARAENATIIPKTALLDSQYVFTIDDSVVHKKKVVVGVSNEEKVQIMSNNVKPGDKVVIKGNVGLYDNSRVEIEN